MFKVLIVDDEEDILDLLAYNFEKEGYEVHRATNGIDAIEIAQKIIPDLVMLDIMMPNKDGVETCRLLRAMPQLKDTSIVFLTARTEEYSELAGFEVGADDYITKPIKPRILMSRIKAILRRNIPETPSTDNSNTLVVSDIEIKKDEYLVCRAGEEMHFPRKEFELLYYLASKAGKICRREDVLSHVWGNDVYVVDRTVDVHIRKIREKLGDEYIQTVKGVGYKFVGR